MTTDNEALPPPANEREQIFQAAALAMPWGNPLVWEDWRDGHNVHLEPDDLIAIWRAALSASPQAPAAQPVAWVEAEALRRVQDGVGSLLTASQNKRGFCDTPLYAAPPAQPQQAVAQPLTEEHKAMNRAADCIAVALQLLEHDMKEAAELALREAHNELVGTHAVGPA